MKKTGSSPVCLARRTFLRTAFLCGTALAASPLPADSVAASPPASTRPAKGYYFLTPDDIPFVRTLLLAVIEPAISTAQLDRERLIASALQQFDDQCIYLSAAMQDVLRQLLTIANVPFVQGLTTGVWQDWDTVALDDAEQFMDRWQHSRLFQFQMSHAALVQLTAMVWYGMPEAAADIDYPGAPYGELLVTAPNNY